VKVTTRRDLAVFFVIDSELSADSSIAMSASVQNRVDLASNVVSTDRPTLVRSSDNRSTDHFLVIQKDGHGALRGRLQNQSISQQ
jgi:hypothetical protein